MKKSTISRLVITAIFLLFAVNLPNLPKGTKVEAQSYCGQSDPDDSPEQEKGAKPPAPDPPEKSPEKKEEAKWDVEAEHGPSTVIEFDTDEGTWINLDVSPDGSKI